MQPTVPPCGLLPQWASTDQLPLRLLCGGKLIQGIPAFWNPTTQVQQCGSTVTETTIRGLSPEGLELRMVHRRYHDFDAEEYAAFLTNRSTSDSPMVENARITVTLPISGATLYHGNGDTKQEDGYEWRTEPLIDGMLSLSPCGDGTSCCGAFPYMRLLLEDRGVNIAIGWSGTWIAEFTRTGDGVTVSSGQKRCRTILHPGETMQIPTLVLVAYNGDADAGCNTWRRWYFAHILPKPKGIPLAPRCCMHLFEAEGKPEFTGATEENQLAAIDAYRQADLAPDVWWIDAGWYPCDSRWANTGNWYANPENFPRGLRPLSDRCHAEGMEFLLWFEPERVRPGTGFFRDHPQWLLHSAADGPEYNNYLVNLGIRECCDYVIEMLDRCIKAYGVDIYRQDFNMRFTRGSAGACWQEAEAENRIGMSENLHIQGYYRMWDTLLTRNPGLLIDSCAGGGRRNDIETMRRAVPLHYTDVGYGHHPIKLKQHRQMFEWIPYFRAHNQNWCNEDGHYDGVNRNPDRYSYYVAMAPVLTDVTKCTADSDAFALAREMQAVWRKAAALMIGTDYYPLTRCRKSSHDFYAAQFHDPTANKGFLHLINGAAATRNEFTAALKGLEKDAVYTVTTTEQACSRTYSGAELMAGIWVTLEKKTGDIWFYEKK